MFGMGMPEIILILAIALIVLGPKKLPEIAKSLGRGIAEFKKATQEFKENIEVDNDLKDARDTLREAKEDLQETVRHSMTDTDPERQSDAGSEADVGHPPKQDEGQDSEDAGKDKPGQEADLKGPAEDA
jgi:TatA/E family protein of Tat protein translocase